VATVTDPRAGVTSEPGRRYSGRRLYLPTVAVAGVAAWLAWRGSVVLSQYGLAHSIHAAQAELAGPVVLGFVLVISLIEQIRPAERHSLLARGHLLDLGYLLVYALAVVPLVVLIDSGFSTTVARLAPWLTLPASTVVPHWCYIALGLLGIDALDWLAHLGNHKIGSLWRLHAVHHSQEELSILTTFRAHPLVHVSFLLSAFPVLVLAANNATPVRILTIYACLGALPHANVRWSYRKAGLIFISPAYHRLHHAPTGRLDINLGTVFAIWDILSRRAVFPEPSRPVAPTGLAGRPVPVEQSGDRPRLARTFLTQWAEPFTTGSLTVEPYTASEVPHQ
jgi:sterol desaturase/sphingolipid hydroxylase (fatty acid hydroxylase superfamily)